MALHRLAAFFQDQHFQARGRRKPVILIGPRASSDGRCLVIGYEATQRIRVRGSGRVAGTGFSPHRPRLTVLVANLLPRLTCAAEKAGQGTRNASVEHPNPLLYAPGKSPLPSLQGTLDATYAAVFNPCCTSMTDCPSLLDHTRRATS